MVHAGGYQCWEKLMCLFAKKSPDEFGWTQLSYNKLLIIKEATKCN